MLWLREVLVSLYDRKFQILDYLINLYSHRLHCSLCFSWTVSPSLPPLLSSSSLFVVLLMDYVIGLATFTLIVFTVRRASHGLCHRACHLYSHYLHCSSCFSWIVSPSLPPLLSSSSLSFVLLMDCVTGFATFTPIVFTVLRDSHPLYHQACHLLLSSSVVFFVLLIPDPPLLVYYKIV